MNTCGTCHWIERTRCLLLPVSCRFPVSKNRPACCDWHERDKGVTFRKSKSNRKMAEAWYRNAQAFKERGRRKRAMLAARKEAVA